MHWKEKTVGIAGCGGLGGNLVEDFLRLGVKHLVVCDGDCFDESNMDRQILCTRENIGTRKVEAAAARARLIAPETEMEVHDVFVDEQNGETLFAGCDVVMDALDNVSSREALRRVCQKLGIPLVHGAIGDWAVQVGVLLPGDQFPQSETVAKKESQVLSFVPAVCAGLQTAEAVKILRGERSSLESRIRYMDLKTGDYIDLMLEKEMRSKM